MPLRGVEKSIKISPWAPKGRHDRSEGSPGRHQVGTGSATAWLEGPRGGPNIKDNRQIYENNDDGARSDTPLGRRPGEFQIIYEPPQTKLKDNNGFLGLEAQQTPPQTEQDSHEKGHPTKPLAEALKRPLGCLLFFVDLETLDFLKCFEAPGSVRLFIMAQHTRARDSHHLQPHSR